ncbi:MAG TPA: CbiX/SirB N-terminal domain-containing protein, partial [Myxococcota bacterium]|nr:CbiX/SirB N-terminal domain-containing protein [Myxococcota bacterium]
MSKTRPPALVIAAHGSKSPAWVQAVEDFAEEVARSPGVAEVFASVATGYLESASPGLAEAVERALASSPEVVVVPLFLTASTHQAEDVPGVLGLPTVPSHVRRRLVGEGVRVLRPGLPITLQPIGDVAEILHKNVLRRTALEVRDRSHEAVVLVAYGSSVHHDQWENLIHDVRLRLLTDGFGGISHAYCGHVVQLSPEPTYKAILAASQQAGVRKVHVVPLLMGPSDLQTGPITVACQAAHPKLAKQHVQLRYQVDAILPDGDLAARVAFYALAARGVTASALQGLSGALARHSIEKA